MPPIASLRLGTSGCDYPSRIEFGKKHTFFFCVLPPNAKRKNGIIHANSSRQCPGMGGAKDIAKADMVSAEEFAGNCNNR